MMDPSTPNLCPECGKPVPADSQHQICPACLMAQALASRTIDVSPATAVPPPTPEEIAGKFPQFEILECLGRGGMGVVYKARQKSLNRLVAIKILAPERVHEARFAERFAREAELLAKLSHPHIVTIHDFGETDGLFYLVMEFVDGVNLRDLMRDGKLEPKQALAIVPPICEALQYAHDKGIVHRDIKPENLLLDRDGRLKIADFGIAKLIEPVAAVCDRRTLSEESQRRSQSAATLNAGTLGYSAPEQESDPQHVDHRADIYALGVVLYEMLTGERPAKEVVAPSKKVQLDVRIDEMVLKALEKTPELRYQTAGEFRTVVETMAGESAKAAAVLPQSTLPRPHSTLSDLSALSPPSRPCGMLRRFWWLFLVMIPVSVLLGIAVGSIYCYVVPKRYESNTKIEVLPDDDETGHNPSFFPKEIAVIVSSEALTEVVRRLDLGQRWKLDRDAAAQHLRSMITVEQIRGTDLLSIRARSTDAAEACDIANNLADAYRVRANADFHAFIENAVPSSNPFGVLSKAMNASRDRVYIHDDAVVSSKPVAPSVPLVLAIAALAGLVLSPALALLVMLILQRRMSRRERREGKPLASPHLVPTAHPADAAGSTAQSGLAETRKWVAAPAIGLMVASGLNLLLAGGLLLVLFMHFGSGLQILSPTPKPTQEFMRMMKINVLLLALIFVACPSLLTFVGAWRMRNLKGYGLAVTAAILAIITPPGMLVGLVFGIWALVVLFRSDVQEAFQREKSHSPGNGCLIAGGVMIGVVLLVILTIIGLRIMAPRSHSTSYPAPGAVVPVPGNASSKNALPNGLKPVPPEALRACEEHDRYLDSLTPQDRGREEVLRRTIESDAAIRKALQGTIGQPLRDQAEACAKELNAHPSGNDAETRRIKREFRVANDKLRDMLVAAGLKLPSLEAFALRWVGRDDDMMAIPVVDPSVPDGKISVMWEPLLKQSMLERAMWNGDRKKLLLFLRDGATDQAVQQQIEERAGDRLAAVWHGKVVGVFTVTKPTDGDLGIPLRLPEGGLEIPLQLPEAGAVQLERELHAALITE